MHLKNYSLITTDGVTKLSPSYNLLNTSIICQAKEELALTLNGKKSNLKKQDLIDYLGRDRLLLTKEDIERTLISFNDVFPKWEELINISFLSQVKKDQYSKLINSRFKKLLN
jgi:serine/threonine-protein kinase HipA